MKIPAFSILLISILFLSCERTLIGHEPENNTISNFEILWKTFDENYSLFTARNINWDSLHTIYSSKISASTTGPELWDITTGLLSNLNDGQVMLFNENWTKYFNAGNIAGRENDFSLNLVENKYLSAPSTAGAGYITYGKIKSTNIGYIYIASFASSNTGNGIDWAYDIDKAIRYLSGCDAMIVDIRNNGGGLRVTGNIINSVFIDRDITYFYQRLKTGPGHNDFGEPKPVTISPRPGIPRFTKKIALLTNKFSASGAEYTAQAFKNLSYSTQIGNTTFGVFGEITSVAQLPNGWIYWYPCTYTYTPDGKCPEGTGIIPDIWVENTKASIDAEKDNVLEYAVQYLSH